MQAAGAAARDNKWRSERRAPGGGLRRWFAIRTAANYKLIEHVSTMGGNGWSRDDVGKIVIIKQTLVDRCSFLARRRPGVEVSQLHP